MTYEQAAQYVGIAVAVTVIMREFGTRRIRTLSAADADALPAEQMGGVRVKRLAKSRFNPHRGRGEKRKTFRDGEGTRTIRRFEYRF
ncbi:MAG TPA: hypothetical protein VFS75_01370 [Candidatus Paceibacterota bacterium]|nr:hypothetical protein [Candidatus Paceibacterota bacterium]